VSEVQDPFISPEADDIMSGLHVLYAAAIKSGFPEQRSFELVHGLFINQMATIQALVLGQAEQEG